MSYDGSGRNRYNGDRRSMSRSFRDRGDYNGTYNEDRRSSDFSRRSLRSDEGMRRNGYDRDNFNPRPYNNSRNYDHHPTRFHGNVRSHDNQSRNFENRRSYIQPRERGSKKTKEQLDRELSVYMAETK
ncbi:hypothetical protein P3W45_001600 [Vairimorpha bombi]|jgi:hypothetical protein